MLSRARGHTGRMCAWQCALSAFVGRTHGAEYYLDAKVEHDSDPKDLTASRALPGDDGPLSADADMPLVDLAQQWQRDADKAQTSINSDNADITTLLGDAQARALFHVEPHFLCDRFQGGRLALPQRFPIFQLFLLIVIYFY